MTREDGGRHVECAAHPAERVHLVLDGRLRPLAVELDGAALRISDGQGPDRLAPVRRVDRATARGRVLWDSAALLALADAGAPVGFLRSDGRLAAVLTGRRAKGGGSLAEALSRAAARPDFAARIEDWRRAAVSFHARALGRTDPSACAREGRAGAEAALVEACGLAPRARATRLARSAQAFAELLARRVLYDAGCPPRWLGGDAPGGGDLAGPFADIALWRLARLLSRPMARAQLAAAVAADRADLRQGVVAEPGARVSRIAELATPRLRRDLAGDIRRFHAFLVDLNLPDRHAVPHRRHGSQPPWAG